VRDQIGSNNAVDKCSASFNAGEIAGTVTPGLGGAAALRGAAALSRFSSLRFLNQNRYLRIGPGNIPGGRPFTLGAGRKVPSLRIGNGRPTSLNHFDLRTRIF